MSSGLIPSFGVKVTHSSLSYNEVEGLMGD
jgi:hypothetical protein